MNQVIEKLKIFRHLSIVELIYNDNKSSIKNKIVQRVVNQLNRNIIAVSIVLNSMNFNILNLWMIIKKIRKKKISVSLTVNCSNVSLLKLFLLKRIVNQFRILIDEEKDDFSIINECVKKLKTSKNEVIFLFSIHSKAENINKYLTLLKENDYIYNISAANSLSVQEYWNLSKITNQAKNKFSLKIFQDLTCAGVIYDNLKGICPVLTSMICIGCNGEIKLCYKDNNQYEYNVFNESLEELFNRTVEEIKFCKDSQCNFNYNDCFCGCPLNFENNCNKFCNNNLKGGM